MRLPFIPAGMDVTVWPPVLATRGPGFRGALHSHHALHFVLALDGELRVRTSAFGPWSSAAGVLTAPDAPHAIDSHCGEVLLVFLDPESDDGATFRPVLDHPVRLLSARERSALVRDVVPRTILRSGADAWVRNAARTMRVALPASPRTIHPRVRRVLRMLRSSGVDDDTSLEVLAIVTGSPLGDAAHAAGFADAAHMSRTFKRMLGVAPSLLRPMRCSEEAALPYR